MCDVPTMLLTDAIGIHGIALSSMKATWQGHYPLMGDGLQWSWGALHLMHSDDFHRKMGCLRKGLDIVNLQEFLATKPELDAHTFGRFVRQRREELGLTVRGFATQLEMTPAYLSDIEKGNRYAPKKYLDKLREALAVPEECTIEFEDLAAATRGNQYEDINPYLGKQPLARVALRKARDLDIADEEWLKFIQVMGQLNAEPMISEQEGD